MDLFLRDLFNQLHCIHVSEGSSVRDLIRCVDQNQVIPDSDFYIKRNGKLAAEDEQVRRGQVYSLEPRIFGGKGGFGSMLRALGAQIEKTTNREACRDLSGRRLRDVNHEKEMAEWLKKQAEREAEKEQRRLERLKRKLADPKHYFTDSSYQQQCHDLSERLEDSVLKGMQASSSRLVMAEEGPSRKKPNLDKTEKPSKNKCSWTGLDGLEDSAGSDDSLGSDNEEFPSKCRASLGETSPESNGTESECSLKNESEAETSSMPCSSLAENYLESKTENKDSPETITEETQPDEELQHVVKSESPVVQEEKDEDQVSQVQSSQKKEEASASLPEIISKAASVYQSDKSAVATSTGPEDILKMVTDAPLDLMTISSVSDLESLGLERLKMELTTLGLKCGGSLQERAARLFSVRGLSKDQINPALFAKSGKAKMKQNK
ncbi:replication stress response regulator SDE2 [Polypterus senegalus]|uniref:replication stress response regulator SDE2 n=1 Tax=Polypterus senegalus TaxID=55291 RepID=UPI0019666DC5|nr:replication stress response regulator SDE2 [Polypterus senegalus]